MYFVFSSSLPLIEGITVLLLTVVNLALCAREERLRRTEMVRSAQDLLSNCDGEQKSHVEYFNNVIINYSLEVYCTYLTGSIFK